MFLYTGAFCTKDYAVGVAARAQREENDYASFFAFGVGQPGSDDPTKLPTMQLVSARSNAGTTCLLQTYRQLILRRSWANYLHSSSSSVDQFAVLPC